MERTHLTTEAPPHRMARAERPASWASARTPPALTAHSDVLRLQRMAGNAAVGRLLQRCGPGGCNCGGTCGGEDLLLDEHY